MEFIKRMLLYLCIWLFISSMYHDLSVDNQPTSNSTQEQSNSNRIEVQVEAGDTVLTVVEHVNHGLHQSFDVNRILSDFKRLNPQADPYKLQPGHYYLFPLYHDPIIH
ncbi:hypothetical protein JNUCC1_03502 [Lentibacillus sp. JNUCC-1]|nr:hypothetical protein [Lentibacillus sp. JNUCC-1]